MKKYFLIPILLLATICTFSQTGTDNSTPKVKPYIATINTMNNATVKGLLYKMEEDTLYLVPQAGRSFLQIKENKDALNKIAFPVQSTQINTIRVQKKNAGTKGMLLGMGAGVITGVVLGFVEGDDPIRYHTGGDFWGIIIPDGPATQKVAAEKAALYGTLGGISGAIVGFITGKLLTKKFTIGGKKENYRNLGNELTKRLIIK